MFTHDTDAALQTAVAVANSGETDGEPLADVASLAAFLAGFGFTGRLDADEAELDAVRALRPVLREVLLADRDDAAELVNEMLARHRAVPQLRRHDQWDWHVHAVEPDRPVADRIVVETAMAMIDVIRADENRRLSVCADEACENVVLDLSRNRSRRYCSTTCGNRNAVAAYRARQADS